MEQSQNKLEEYLHTAAVQPVRGTVSYSLVDISTARSYEWHAEDKFRAASLIKIPILWTYLREVKNGSLNPAAPIALSVDMFVEGTGVLRNRSPGSTTTLEEAASLMISESDNIATNLIIDRLGFQAINTTIDNLGLSSTRLARKMWDFDAAARGHENVTCARDMSRLLERVARERSRRGSLETAVFQHLSAQRLNTKLPHSLPANMVCAHKTGDLPGLEHDAGILTDHKRDVVVVALSDELSDNADGVKFCQEIWKAACLKLTT